MCASVRQHNFFLTEDYVRDQFQKVNRIQVLFHKKKKKKDTRTKSKNTSIIGTFYIFKLIVNDTEFNHDELYEYGSILLNFMSISSSFN